MFNRISLSSFRKPLIFTSLALGLVNGATKAHAADYFTDPVQRQPENTPYVQVPLARENPQSQATAVPSGRLTIEQVGQVLDATFPGKNTITNNGQTYYTINIQKGTWKFHLVISLSPNNNVLWIDAPLVKIADPAAVSPAAMVDLLKKNADLGPIFFQVNGDQMLELTEPIPNRDLTVESFARGDRELHDGSPHDRASMEKRSGPFGHE